MVRFAERLYRETDGKIRPSRKYFEQLWPIVGRLLADGGNDKRQSRTGCDLLVDEDRPEGWLACATDVSARSIRCGEVLVKGRVGRIPTSDPLRPRWESWRGALVAQDSSPALQAPLQLTDRYYAFGRTVTNRFRPSRLISSSAGLSALRRTAVRNSSTVWTDCRFTC